jgi:hypothetical protein
MKHSSGPFPPAAGANTLHPQFAFQRSQGRKPIGMLVRIFFNAGRSSTSNGRCMRGLSKTSPPLVSALVGTAPGERLAAKKETDGTPKRTSRIQKGAHHGR